jgi:tetrahydromethanopterin:alpha-L-glutamate ligase
MTRARVAIFVDEPDWHTRRLAASFAELGAAATVLSLSASAFVLGAGGSGIALPGFDGALPDAALVRTIAAGSFEQVTLRLGILHALAAAGVPVINDAQAIERSVDKSMTSFLLHRAGIPTPPTFAGESDAQAAQWMASVTEDRVAKPLFGSQGRGLIRLAPGDALPPADIYAGVRYLQRFAGRDSSWRDYRVMVVGKAPAAAMLRHGKSWITNVRRGARCEMVAATGDLAALSLAAVGAVGADYAGVDLIEDRSGALLVLEVNSMPAWKGLQSVASCDIASLLARHVLSRLA